MPRQVAGPTSGRRSDPAPAGSVAGRSAGGRLAAARGDFYRFLAAVYLGPPAPTLLRELADPDTRAKLSRLFGRRVAAKLEDFAASVEADLLSLKKEYMALFAVPTGRYVTPFEDVYRGTAGDGQPERGPLLGERAIAVKRLYRAAGARVDQACKELPTHIGVELSFMSFLCSREAKALKREPVTETGEISTSECYRALERRFLRDHLADWFPRLCEAIQSSATSPFYKGVALLTEEFIAWDSAQVLSRAGPGNGGGRG